MKIESFFFAFFSNIQIQILDPILQGVSTVYELAKKIICSLIGNYKLNNVSIKRKLYIRVNESRLYNICQYYDIFHNRRSKLYFTLNSMNKKTSKNKILQSTLTDKI